MIYVSKLIHQVFKWLYNWISLYFSLSAHLLCLFPLFSNAEHSTVCSANSLLFVFFGSFLRVFFHLFFFGRRRSCSLILLLLLLFSLFATVNVCCSYHASIDATTFRCIILFTVRPPPSAHPFIHPNFNPNLKNVAAHNVFALHSSKYEYLIRFGFRFHFSKLSTFQISLDLSGCQQFDHLFNMTLSNTTFIVIYFIFYAMLITHNLVLCLRVCAWLNH